MKHCGFNIIIYESHLKVNNFQILKGEKRTFNETVICPKKVKSCL